MKPESWFESWFNSPYYHLLYKNRNEKEAQDFLDLLLTRIHLIKSSKVLDLACGKGRHSIYLNQCGYDVIGVDLSEENILHCKKFEKDHLQFFRHDMRRVLRTNYFDAVFNLFTSFGYFEREHENELVIQSTAKNLQSGGYFILDYLNSYYAEKHLVSNQSKEVEGIQFQISKKIEAGKIVKNISFEDRGKVFQFTEEVRLLYPEDFLRFFAKAGLSVLEIYGDYSLNHFSLDQSKRLIFVTRKL